MALDKERPWWLELRKLHDEQFVFDWRSHVKRLNSTYSFDFSTPDGLAPPWFNGDVEALEPGNWVLVVSLNPQLDVKLQGWYATGKFDTDLYWHHWRTHNRRRYYPGFFRPLVMVASGALGQSVSKDEERDFATRRMCFVEICPYASATFDLTPEQVKQLVAEDVGFGVKTQVREMMIEQARPRIVLVNGNPAVDAMEAVHEEKLAWEEWEQYPAGSPEGRMLWWRRGMYRGPHRVPVVGFPFLNKPRTARSHDDYQQLGRKINALAEKGN